MKNLTFGLLCLMGIISLTNCKKNDCDCGQLFSADSIANFVYSLEYSSTNNYVYIGLTNTGNIKNAADTEYEWYLNGRAIGDGKSTVKSESNNGHYTAVHKVIYMGNEYSSVKEFDITGLQ